MKYQVWFILFYGFLASTTFAQEGRPDGYQYLFPGPGAQRVHPATTLILRFESISPQELKNQETFIHGSGSCGELHAWA